MTTTATTTTPGPQVGKRTELGRYTLPDGAVRLVMGQRSTGQRGWSTSPSRALGAAT